MFGPLLDHRLLPTDSDGRWAKELELGTTIAPATTGLLAAGAGYLSGGLVGAGVGAVAGGAIYTSLRLLDRSYARRVLRGRSSPVSLAIRIAIPSLVGMFTCLPILDHVLWKTIEQEQVDELNERRQKGEAAIETRFADRINVASDKHEAIVTRYEPIRKQVAARAEGAIAALAETERKLGELKAERIKAAALADCEELGSTACKGATGFAGRRTAYMNAKTLENNLTHQIAGVEERRKELLQAAGAAWVEPEDLHRARDALEFEQKARKDALDQLERDPAMQALRLGPIERAVLVKRAVMRDSGVFWGIVLAEVVVVFLECIGILLVRNFSSSKAAGDSRALALEDEAEAFERQAAATEKLVQALGRIITARQRHWEVRRRSRSSRNEQRIVDGLQVLSAGQLWRKS